MQYNRIKKDELLDLDITIAMFVVPRLILLKQLKKSYPGTLKNIKEWHKVIDKMIRGFKLIKKCKHIEYEVEYKKHIKDINIGLDLFRKYFNSLWI